jgi:Tfp pilus assembly protein PilV
VIRPLLTRLRRGEAGISMIEVLISMLILTIGVGATMSVFPAASRQTQTGQLQEQASAVAEREIESIRRMGWANLGLKTLPAATGTGLAAGDANQNNPRLPSFYVNGAAFQVKQNPHNSTSAALPGTPAAGEALIVTGADGADATSTFSADGTTGTIYRYVTARNETCAPALPTNLLNNVVNALTGLLQNVLTPVNNILGTRINAFCAGPGPDAKRVTVAVVLDTRGNRAGPTRPVYLSTIITDPQRGLLN